MGVREFLSYVVPSNTLDHDEFRARCIDVMEGSVRRNQGAAAGDHGGDNMVTVTCLQHQLCVKFRAVAYTR